MSASPARRQREEFADPAEEKPPKKSAPPETTRGPTQPAQTPKTLTIDLGVEFDGHVRDCDVMRVGGRVRGTIVDSESLTVVESGRFEGKAEILSCEVAGEFVGTLVVRGKLTIRTSGRVSGSIQYGYIEIERGGQLQGSVSLGAPEPDLLSGVEWPTSGRVDDRGQSVDQIAKDISAIFGSAARKAIREHEAAGRKVYGVVGSQLLSRSPDGAYQTVADLTERQQRKT